MNGYKGVNFSDRNLDRKACHEACCRVLDDSGCVAFLPTVITSRRATYEHVLPILADVILGQGPVGNQRATIAMRRRVLGVHMEGPFISAAPGARGCHPEEHVIPVADSALLWHWQALAKGQIRLMTIAAEAAEDPEAADFFEVARELGIAVSLGHQMATSEQVAKMAARGASLVTHLGNGLPSEIDWHKNPLWAALADDRLSAMLITDGHHLPAFTIASFLRAKGVPNVIITSDVAPVAGLPDGVYEWAGGEVLVEGTNVRVAGTPYLAGSGALMIDCVKHLARVNFCPRPGSRTALSLRDLEAVAFDNPLRAIGVDPEAFLRDWEADGLGWAATVVALPLEDGREGHHWEWMALPT